MALRDAWSRENLHLAWRRLTTGRNIAYKRYFRSLYYAYEIGLEENIKDLHARLKGGSYQPQPPTKVYLPKPSGLQRPITLLCIEDQIVLQAIANVFANKLQARRRTLEHKYVFSNIVQPDDNSIFFLHDWRVSYSKFQSRIAETFHAGYCWIAHFDLAAYYDTICHDLLLRTAFPRTTDNENRKRIMESLKKWSSEPISSGHAHGIPQGPIASDYLAECFLLPVDEVLCEKLRYVRYVDDIRLFAKSEKDVVIAAIEMEIVLRERGLLPQGKKHAITHAKTVDDAMGILPSIEPRDDGGQPEEHVLSPQDAVKKFRSALSRKKPQTITDKTRARYVLFHAEPSSKLSGLVLRLMPRHPEHIDAFVHYLSRCRASLRIVTKCLDVLRATPYQYVQGEMWHILARMMEPHQMRRHLNRAAKAAKEKSAGLSLKWGVCHFLYAAERMGLGRHAEFTIFRQNSLLQALLVPVLPVGRFQRNDVVEKLLRHSTPEPGIALAERLVQLELTHQSFGIQAKSLPKQVQNVFRRLGLIKGPVAAVDPMGEILTRRYGTPRWDGWKSLVASEYSHALQLLSIADAAYDMGRSQWLSYQNSFNHSLLLAFLNWLTAKRLLAVVKTVGSDGKAVKFGALVDPNQAFAKAHPIVASAFAGANTRRNMLPGSHPYEQSGGKRTQHLRKKEQAKIGAELTKAYAEIVRIGSTSR